MNPTVQSTILGAVQGATEFLPISSDGHLALTGFLLGISDMTISQVVLLHVATLLATCIGFKKEIPQLFKELLNGGFWPIFKSYGVALVATAVVGLLLEDSVEPFSKSKIIVGMGFLGSAIAVATTRWSLRNRSAKNTMPPPIAPVAVGLPRPGHALIIGLAQGLAVLPGLSRSASTIAVAIGLGMAPDKAVVFSFLLSIPAIAGATLLTASHSDGFFNLDSATIVGMVTAFWMGFLCLKLVRHVVNQGRFWGFALYLIPLGLGLMVWDKLNG